MCTECAVESEELAAALSRHLQQNRKVIRLNQCSGCQRSVTLPKFSRDWGICKSCVADVQEKSKIARSNFIVRTVNNFHKLLKGVPAL